MLSKYVVLVNAWLNESTNLKVHNAQRVHMIVTENYVEIIYELHDCLHIYGNCHVAWSVLHIELACMPNRTNRALLHKMADLYAKSSDKPISLEIDHRRQNL